MSTRAVKTKMAPERKCAQGAGYGQGRVRAGTTAAASSATGTSLTMHMLDGRGIPQRLLSTRVLDLEDAPGNRPCSFACAARPPRNTDHRDCLSGPVSAATAVVEAVQVRGQADGRRRVIGPARRCLRGRRRDIADADAQWEGALDDILLGARVRNEVAGARIRGKDREHVGRRSQQHHVGIETRVAALSSLGRRCLKDEALAMRSDHGMLWRFEEENVQVHVQHDHVLRERPRQKFERGCAAICALLQPRGCGRRHPAVTFVPLDCSGRVGMRLVATRMTPRMIPVLILIDWPGVVCWQLRRDHHVGARLNQCRVASNLAMREAHNVA
mmetsp:Transcript_33860/g.72274  ORF Transcript_33860/g.72274 Transcript_33860/m.72274 type:complete len:329 (+) Transcript_33860:640-1626(+)